MKELCLAILGFGLIATAASAADEIMTIKGKVISSESELHANSVVIEGGATGDRFLSSEDDSVTAFGYGGDFDFRYAEYGHAGFGVAYVDYPNDNEKLSYRDLSANAYAAVDLFRQPLFNIVLTGGVSYHDLELKDTKMGAVTVAYDDIDLWNYDASLGVEGSLSKEMSIGLAYQYTGTFEAEGVDANYSGPSIVPGPARLKDMKLTKNEVFGSVGYKF